MGKNVIPLSRDLDYSSLKNSGEYLSDGVELVINPVFSNNSRRPKTQLCFQDIQRRNSYTRTIEGACEIGAYNEIIIHNTNGERVPLIDIFPDISSWIISNSPTQNITARVASTVSEIVPGNQKVA